MKRKRGKEMGKYKYLVIFIALVTFGLEILIPVIREQKQQQVDRKLKATQKIKPVCYVIIIRMNQEYGMLKENNILTDLY